MDRAQRSRGLFAAAVCPLLMLFACATDTAAPSSSDARTGMVSMRGKPLTLEGSAVNVGDAAPDFRAIANDMSEARLSDFRGRTVILATVPSLDTGTCDRETRTFNERASALGEDTVIITVSRDLPFAQKRWCAAAGVERVITLSDYRFREVGELYGLAIRENGLLARAVLVIDPEGVIRYQQIVPNVGDEPDYAAALAAAETAAPRRQRANIPVWKRASS